MCTKEQQGSITIVFLVSSCPSLLPTGGLGPCHARFFLFPISPSFVHFKYSALVLYLNTVFILMLLCSKILSPARENPSSLIPRHPFILPLCPGTSSCSKVDSRCLFEHTVLLSYPWPISHVVPSTIIPSYHLRIQISSLKHCASLHFPITRCN